MEALDPTFQPVLAYLTAASIPVVAYALWLHYFEQFVDERSQHGLKVVSPEQFETDIGRLRGAGIFTFFSQGLIYVASIPLRQEQWGLCAVYFIGTILAQNILMTQAERRLRSSAPASSSEEGRKSNTQVGAVGLRLLAWNIVSALAYISIVQLTALSCAVAAHLAGFSKEAVMAIAVAGGMMGIGLGLLFTFAIAPAQARHSFLAQPVRDPHLSGLLSDAWAKSAGKKPPPKYWIVQSPDDRWVNAWVAGFSRARGFFGANLFLTQSLTSHFGLPEIEVIVLHEMAHISRNHLGKRLAISIASISFSTALLGAFTYFALRSLPPEWLTVSVLGIAAVSMILPIRKIRSLVDQQELEADHVAVEQQGGDPSILISVLERLSALSSLPQNKAALARRIDRIKKDFPQATEGESSRLKAA